ncbi:fungal-specific transcription factor domain-containing protein [Xylaria bambusicola]|uniref:fungal-specific transcription factor domain-containing protein n=1 Tax=Xylaria bambusicola TaxID=326684 RepID=UPI0020087D3A|nr:fungal-specific transcription factor domain-containing protein [Xylaria bambusicola]KAI0517082.1 fungal-specific transcription factor domain-containing protein [Xylaria bambusicola]
MRSETTNAGGQVSSSPLNVAIHSLLQECKQMSQGVKVSRPGRLLSCPEPIVSSPAMADHLINLYESNIEIVFRILHRPSFRNEYDRYKLDPTDVADVTMLKIQLVIAIGSGLCPEMASAKEVRRAACQWLYAAHTWLSGPIEKDRLSISSIQVQCLLILARQVLSVGGDLSWVAMGMLLRTAMQMGLHRDPKHFPGISSFEAEIRRRLWATVLELNAQASLDSGTPPGISLDDFDTRPPTNVNDEDMGEDSINFRQHNETVQTDTSLQRFLLQNLPPRLEMLRRMNGLGINLEDERILALSASLNTACREIDAQVSTDPDTETASCKRNMASLLLRRFLLVLHRPLAGRIRENALYYHSRKMSFDSAMSLLKPPIVNNTFSYLMLRGGGLFKSCLIHASLALASELLIEIEEQGSGTYRQMLVDAVREARQQWVQRIKLGDPNFRLHMKLSIVLDQAEYVGEEEGQFQQQRMAKSTKESLELCHSLIQEHVRSTSTTISSEYNAWISQGLHPACSNEESDLSRECFSFNDILQMNSLDIGGGAFDSNTLLL